VNAAKAIVESEIESIPNAAIDFQGWTECPSGTPPYGTYRFVVNRADGGRSSRGYVPDDAHTFAGGNLESEAWDTFVLHEMTHVLGFSHEFDRPDSPVNVYALDGGGFACEDAPSVNEDTGQPFVGRELTIYDPTSIASQTYCAASSTGHLSRLDKLGLEIAYYNGSGSHAVGAIDSFLIDNAVLLREDSTIAVDWTLQGATEEAFLNPVMWHVLGFDVSIALFLPGFIPPSVVTSLTADFDDFKGRHHTASGNVLVDDG
jgi:hypothetical protein